MKAMVHTLDIDTDFFHIVTVILQADTLTPFLFIVYKELCTKNINKSNERKWFHIKKTRSKGYPATIITDADYT